MNSVQKQKNRGRIDRNGFPVLDPPKSRNKLPKKCHDRMHQFVVTSDRPTGLVDEASGREQFRLERTCRICGHLFVETRWQ